MQCNAAGIALIQAFEGCRLTAYRDIVGVLTIGYGHCGPDVTEGLIIDPEQANELLRQDLARFEAGVTGLVTVDLSPNQFSSLVCFSYNLGLGALGSSTLLKCVNAQDFDGAAAEFPHWDHAGGNVVDGLLRRREAEQRLFQSSS